MTLFRTWGCCLLSAACIPLLQCGDAAANKTKKDDGSSIYVGGTKIDKDYSYKEISVDYDAGYGAKGSRDKAIGEADQNGVPNQNLDQNGQNNLPLGPPDEGNKNVGEELINPDQIPPLKQDPVVTPCSLISALVNEDDGDAEDIEVEINFVDAVFAFDQATDSVEVTYETDSQILPGQDFTDSGGILQADIANFFVSLANNGNISVVIDNPNINLPVNNSSFRLEIGGHVCSLELSFDADGDLIP